MSSVRRRRTVLVRAAVALVAGASVLTPVAGSAQEDPTQRREEVRERQAQVDLEIDTLQARDAEIESAMARLTENVATQEAELAEAERAARAAEDDVVEAQHAVDRARLRIAELDAATDEMVVEAFVNPPSAGALEAFNADTMSDAAIKQALIGLQADHDADLLDQLDAARQDMELEQANKEEAAAEAEERRSESASQLTDLRDALSQQQEFASDVEDRIDQRLAEAESLRAMDADLSHQIAAQQAELARQLRAAQEAQAAAQAAAGTTAPAPSGGTSISSAPGGLVTVRCPTGGTITVAGQIAGDVQGLLDLAGQQGVGLCGSGYRDPAQQIELRREHCGTDDYAIYQMPSTECNPPTARPGRSNHEKGLAIDFNCNGGGAIEVGNECWNFLVAHANDYGLYNYPPEPWHWSPDAR